MASVAAPQIALPSMPHLRPRSGKQNNLSTLVLLGFLLFQILCQLMLLTEYLGGLRAVVRAAVFGSSIFLLFVLAARSAIPSPLNRLASLVVLIVSLGGLHPYTNSATSGLAQFVLYLGVLGPVFWCRRLRITPEVFRIFILMLLAYHTLSAFIGILQVYYPGSFQFRVSTALLNQGESYLDGLKIRLSSGDMVYRPMGLTDTPGGAGIAGMYAFLFGMALVVQSNINYRIIGASAAAIGIFCIYVCQIRSIFVMVMISVLAIIAVLLRNGDLRRLTVVVILLPVVAIGGFIWATSVAEQAVTSRLGTLIVDRADAVYQRNRGMFLEQTINEYIPKYPLGAGLGRWGMAYVYLGDPTNPNGQPIHVEIQITGWVLDGGIMLVCAYYGLLIVTLLGVWRIATRRGDGPLKTWAIAVLAYDVGVFAVTFNYAVFIGQTGMEFWLLNASLFAADYMSRQRDPSRIHVQPGKSLAQPTIEPLLPKVKR